MSTTLAAFGYGGQLRVASAEAHLVGRALVECLLQPPEIVTIEVRRELLPGLAAKFGRQGPRKNNGKDL